VSATSNEALHEFFAASLGSHLAPLQDLLQDPRVTEIAVNGRDRVYVERSGRFEPAAVRFEPDALETIIRAVAQFMGRRSGEDLSRLDARLPGGERFTAVQPPVSQHPCISIRKASSRAYSLEDLVAMRALDQRQAEALSAVVRDRRNLLVSGGTGSGKTTLLRALCQRIDPGDRVMVLEDTRELNLDNPHLVSLEARGCTLAQLIHTSLRMRPDRVILGEIRSGADANDFLTALNLGHDGGLGTVHASSARLALSRLENLLLSVRGESVPLRAIRMEVCTAVQCVVQVARGSDGRRRVSEIVEIHPGLDDRGDVVLAPLRV